MMKVSNHSSDLKAPHHDIEKYATISSATTNVNPPDSPVQAPSNQETLKTPPTLHRLARWNAKIESLAGIEARGISRVTPEEKETIDGMGYLQMFALWFGTQGNFLLIRHALSSSLLDTPNSTNISSLTPSQE